MSARSRHRPLIAGGASAKPFYQHPAVARLLAARGVSHGAQLLYQALCRAAGNKGYTWALRRRLAPDVCRSHRQVGRYERELVEKGFLSRVSVAHWHPAWAGPTAAPGVRARAGDRPHGCRRLAMPHHLQRGRLAPLEALATAKIRCAEGLRISPKGASRARKTIRTLMSALLSVPPPSMGGEGCRRSGGWGATAPPPPGKGPEPRPHGGQDRPERLPCAADGGWTVTGAEGSGATKPPPSSPETERALLGALILDPDRMEEVAGRILPRHFTDRHARSCWEVLADIGAADPSRIVLETVMDALRQRHEPDQGWTPWMAETMQATSSSAFVPEYVRILRETSQLRGLITVCKGLLDRAATTTPSMEGAVDALVEEASEALWKVAQRGGRAKDFPNVAEVLQQVLAEFREHKDGLPTGIAPLDRMLAGMQDGRLHLLAARPSCGKSSFAIMFLMEQMALEAESGRVPVFLSLEMSTGEVIARLLACAARVDSKKIQMGKLHQSERTQLDAGVRRIGRSKAVIIPESSASIGDLVTWCRRIETSGQRVGTVFIDYLQLMHDPESRTRKLSRNEEVGAISRGLKRLAKDLNVPVVAMCQLSRAGSGQPKMEHLRESGNLEQDADVIMLLWRDDQALLGHVGENTNNANGHEVWCDVAKHRMGATGRIPLWFQPRYSHFSERALGDPTEQPRPDPEDRDYVEL